MALDDTEKSLMKWAYLQGALDHSNNSVDAADFIVLAEMHLEETVAEKMRKINDG